MARTTPWTTTEVKAKLETDDKWLYKGVVALFERQTKDEQRVEDARIVNNVGFNKPDSHKMSYYAKWIMKKGRLDGHFRDDARRRILKYSAQLTKIADKEL